MALKELFEELLAKIEDAAHVLYGDRLFSIAVYGSVARGTMRPDSDIDLLIVARDLPRGRMQRVKEFERLEDYMGEDLHRVESSGIRTTLAPVIKTPEEVLAGSPLFLDMVEDARLLYDRGNFLAQHLAGLRRRLANLGAKRIWQGNAWYWDLKPDYKPGEVFEL